MKPSQDRLVRHLVIAIALKLMALTVLWWAFIKDEQVSIDSDRAAAHLDTAIHVATSPTGTASATIGEQP